MIIDAKNMQYAELNKMIRDSDEQKFTLENVLGQRYIGAGLSGKEILIKGTPGNALGAYLNGAKISVHGNAQDATGDTMNDGAIIIHGNSGDTTGYAMRSGEIYVQGNAGYRVGIHMKSYQDMFPTIVIGGKVGDFLGEYQAGGLIIVLNLANSRPTGFFTGTGMHGGKMFIRTEKSPENLSPKIEAQKATKADLKEIQKYIEEFCRLFSKNKDEILNSSFYVITPDSNNPYKELYVQN